MSTVPATEGSITGSAGGPYTITFTGTLGDTDLEDIVVDGTLLVGGAGAEGLAVATTTASAGPHHWDDADNWVSGSVPVNGDAVFIGPSATSDILYGIDQNAVTLVSLTIEGEAKIGLPVYTDTGYREYRETELKIGVNAGLLIVNSDSQRLKINVGSVQMAAEVYATGGREGNVPTLLVNGTHASNTLLLIDGDMGCAVFPTEATVLDTITQRGGDLELGTDEAASVTVNTSIEKTGGTLITGEVTMATAQLVMRG